MSSVIEAKCRKIGLYADCKYTECRYAECLYAECRGAKKAGSVENISAIDSNNPSIKVVTIVIPLFWQESQHVLTMLK
jgi:hypothetical protein